VHLDHLVEEVGQAPREAGRSQYRAHARGVGRRHLAARRVNRPKEATKKQIRLVAVGVTCVGYDHGESSAHNCLGRRAAIVQQAVEPPDNVVDRSFVGVAQAVELSVLGVFHRLPHGHDEV